MGPIGKVNLKHNCWEMQKEACSQGAQTLLPSLILTEPTPLLLIARARLPLTEAAAHSQESE